jgi:hypothetical protein
VNFLHKGALRFLAVNVQSELDSEIVFFIAPAVQKNCAQIFLLRKIKFKRGCKIIFLLSERLLHFAAICAKIFKATFFVSKSHSILKFAPCLGLPSSNRLSAMTM